MKKTLSPQQQAALGQIATLMGQNDLTFDDVRRTTGEKQPLPAIGLLKGEAILRLFSYLGGTLIFGGLGVFSEMIWEDIGSLPRVILTLGAGFTAYILGLVFAYDKRFEKVATPAMLVAFVLQPSGLFVFLNEYFKGGDPAAGSMLVFGLMALQQGLTFIKFRRVSLFLYAMLYILGFASAFTEYYDIDRGLASLMLGLFYFFITVDIQKRDSFKDLTPFFYILSTGLFFSGLYYFIGRTVFDPVGLAFSLALLMYSTFNHSKTLYVLACLYTGAYFCGGPGGGWNGWGDYNELTAIFTGGSLMLAGHWLKSKPYISLYPVWMFLGSGYALGGAFALVWDTAWEPLYAALPVLGIYAALVLSSRAVLSASVIALLGFIVSFTAKHFANTVGWPILLILIGFLILGAGFIFARFSGRIRHAAQA